MNTKTACILLITALAGVCVLADSLSNAHVGVYTKEDLIEFTPECKGEGFPEGCLKLSDDILHRMKGVSIEKAWAVTEGNIIIYNPVVKWRIIP